MSARFSIIPARAIYDTRLSRGALLVLNALGIHGDLNGWCWPSQGTIAKCIRLHRTSVTKYIAELEQLGYIEQRRQTIEGKGETSSLYRILFDGELPAEFDAELQQADAKFTPPVNPEFTPPVNPEFTPPVNPEFTPPVNPGFTPPVNPGFTRTSHLTPQGTTHRNAPCERAQAPDTHTATPSAPRVEPTPATTEPVATKATATALPEPTAPAKPARQAKGAKAVKVAAEPLPDAPEWLPADLWQAFIAHRQGKGKDKALTASSATLTLKQLEKAKGFGHDPVALVESAIANGWTGCVFDKHLKPAPTTPTTATKPLNGQRYPSNDPHEKHGRLVTGNNSAIEQWLNRDNPASPFTVTVIPTPVLEITHANH